MKILKKWSEIPKDRHYTRLESGKEFKMGIDKKTWSELAGKRVNMEDNDHVYLPYDGGKIVFPIHYAKELRDFTIY